ncbi:molybdopterin-dependent oxidoreductase [Paracoccaceae bacterium]|nr:molybdopterin-dependent oxidoreductase [Paracoccaceae bacterium]
MSRFGKIARRTFLIGSAAVVGGVAFGAYKYRSEGENPLLEDLGTNEAAITPYVKIDANGITLITPRADKGQGAYSIQAALIAEELDVDLDQINVDPGPPSPTYYNTAISNEAVPFKPTDDGFMAESMRTVADAAMKFMGMQITGGSTTVPDGYEKLRQAGAVARETLKAAAHEKTGVHVTRMKTRSGHVILPDGQELSYQSLASIAADIDPVRDVALRAESEWRYIGKPMQRLDVQAKSTGTQNYGIDFELPGMLHATVKLNPHQGGATATDYDAADALSMRGVKGVHPVMNGIAVVADNTWRAFQAADMISANWPKSDMPDTMEGHWQALSDAFKEDQQEIQNRDDGDVEAELAKGDVLNAEYRAPYVAHAPLEPINATVLMTDDRIDIWTGTQIPRFIENNVAKLTGFEHDQIHLHVLMMGGSFGHRLEDDVVRQAVQVAMEYKGTPIKLTYRREEDMMHDYTRQIAMARASGRVENGQVSAMDLGIAMPSVVASQMSRQGISLPGPDAIIVTGAWEQPFDVPNLRVTGYRAKPLAPLSSWRSVGASTNAFFHEGMMDELIHAAGADPLAERLRLCSHEPSRKVLEKVGEMSNWGAPLGENRGRGLAFCWSFGVATAEVVDITVTENGIRIDDVYIAAEVGKVVDPINFDNLVKGGVIYGLGHAMNCEITYTDGIAEQDNFWSHEGMRMHQTPRIHVAGLENGSKIRGIGEPPVPPAAPALANAIFDATGQRLREMPFSKFVDFA